jgi:hypothetical protein
MGEMRNVKKKKTSVVNLRVRDHLGDVSVDGGILK